MALDPQYVKAGEVVVGDIVCVLEGNRMVEILTVQEVTMARIGDTRWVTVDGDGQSEAHTLDERIWVLRPDG